MDRPWLVNRQPYDAVAILNSKISLIRSWRFSSLSLDVTLLETHY